MNIEINVVQHSTIMNKRKQDLMNGKCLSLLSLLQLNSLPVYGQEVASLLHKNIIAGATQIRKSCIFLNNIEIQRLNSKCLYKH